MPDGTYQPKVYREQGGDKLVVKSGGRIEFESGGQMVMPTGLLKVTLVSGGSAGNHTLTGIEVGDEIVFVGHFSTAAAIATLADITSEFSVTAADTINNAAGTDTTSDQLQVIWIDRTP